MLKYLKTWQSEQLNSERRSMQHLQLLPTQSGIFAIDLEKLSQALQHRLLHAPLWSPLS